MVNYVYVQIGQTRALQDFDSTVFLIGKGKRAFFPARVFCAAEARGDIDSLS